MTIQRMVELLEIEHKCMLKGSHDDCDRNCADCELVQDDNELHEMYTNVIAMLKEQEAKQYNSHEVACIIADLFGDPCACNFNDIDTWLPYKCDFRETCCPNPVGVACWEQYLKHREGR